MRKVFIMFLSVLLIIVSITALNKTGDKKVKDNIVLKQDKTIPVNEPITIPTTNTTNVNNFDYSSISTFKSENIERYKSLEKSNPDLTKDEIVKRVNINLDYKFYEKTLESINQYTPLVLVNKYYYIKEDYIPNDLENVNIKYATNYNIKAVKDAVTKFSELCNDASNLGLTIKTISAYRSYDYQKALYEGYLKNDKVEIVDTYSARAGHSEHQTGYAFDIYNEKVSYTSFGITDEYKWVRENAHRYGFIIRYTKSNEYITGYKNEPWHLRYVGIENATYIYNNNITLEEYLLNKK